MASSVIHSDVLESFHVRLARPLLEDYHQRGVELHHSLIHRRGLFPTAAIYWGEFIWEYAGAQVSAAESNLRERTSLRV